MALNVSLSWLCGAAIGCSNLPDSPAQLTQAISGGERDEAHPAVFRVLGREDGQNFLCSATLIAPNLMLTARHCVSATPEGFVRCGEFTFGADVEVDQLLFANDVEPDLDSTWFRAAKLLFEAEAPDLCGHDIALVMLEESVPSSRALPLSPELTAEVVTGMSYQSVGYGRSDADADMTYGVRRIRESLSVSCGTGTCEGAITDAEFRGSEGVCKGDSGGPALDSAGRVVGVVSRAVDPCETPVYTSVSSFSQWLQASALGAAKAGGYSAPPWAGGPNTADAAAEARPELEVLPAEEGGCNVGVRVHTVANLRPLLAYLGFGLWFCRRRSKRAALNSSDVTSQSTA